MHLLDYHAYYGNKKLTKDFGFPDVLKQKVKNKMVYNPNKSKEGEDKELLPKDSIIDGEIISIDDGKLPDFVKEQYLKSWSGDRESQAIQVTVECKVEKEKIEFTQIFTYTEEDGETVYTPKSNLGKFKAKYEKLPEIALKVKVVTNSDGFGKIKLD